MFHIFFLFSVAKMQYERGGVGGYFTPSDCMLSLGMSRTTVHRYTRDLMAGGYVVRVSHGRYQIAQNEKTLQLGLCIVTPIDVYEHANKAIESAFANKR